MKLSAFQGALRDILSMPGQRVQTVELIEQLITPDSSGGKNFPPHSQQFA
jgi:hypothetical protein